MRFRAVPRCLLTLPVLLALATSAGAQDGDLYELRTYTTNPGKLGALHARFANHTQRIFERHGMRNVAYWVPSDQADTLIYVIAHADEDAAKANWEAFIADPEWQQVYRDSIADGALISNIDSVFMSKTTYSP
ncbi:MAG TPA: NIPSNAP family protein [Pseudomonadales bacterium]|nr:NIPSNAP family protein [Pseudomonadales bacterium]